MTKKHFAAIAKIIEESAITWGEKQILVEKFSEIFKQTNARFDKQKFKEACGL